MSILTPESAMLLVWQLEVRGTGKLDVMGKVGLLVGRSKISIKKFL
jgi:hypothetical protein